MLWLSLKIINVNYTLLYYISITCIVLLTFEKLKSTAYQYEILN